MNKYRKNCKEKQKDFFLVHVEWSIISIFYRYLPTSLSPWFILHSHSLALDIQAHYQEHFKVLLGKQASQVSTPLNIPDGLSPGCLWEVYWWEAVTEIGCGHKAGGNPWNAYCYWFEKSYSTEHSRAPVPEVTITGHKIIVFATLTLDSIKMELRQFLLL